MLDREQQAQFALDPREERLLRDGHPVHLPGKAFSLLKLFAESPNRLLTKDVILQNVWNGIHVTEDLVKEYVHDLRLALGDDAKRPKYIETVRGRGYRFLGGIELVDGASPRTALHSRDRSVPPSVAVLPLDNLTDDERWERFARGLSDDLITDLSRYPDLLIIAKSSCFEFAAGQDASEIGRELRADYVLKGSLQIFPIPGYGSTYNCWRRNAATKSGRTAMSAMSAISLRFKMMWWPMWHRPSAASRDGSRSPRDRDFAAGCRPTTLQQGPLRVGRSLFGILPRARIPDDTIRMPAG